MAQKEVEKPEADRTTTWVDRDLIRMAKVIAAECDESVQDVINGILRPPLTRRYNRVKNRELGEAGA